LARLEQTLIPRGSVEPDEAELSERLYEACHADARRRTLEWAVVHREMRPQRRFPAAWIGDGPWVWAGEYLSWEPGHPKGLAALEQFKSLTEQLQEAAENFGRMLEKGMELMEEQITIGEGFIYARVIERLLAEEEAAMRHELDTHPLRPPADIARVFECFPWEDRLVHYSSSRPKADTTGQPTASRAAGLAQPLVHPV